MTRRKLSIIKETFFANGDLQNCSGMRPLILPQGLGREDRVPREMELLAGMGKEQLHHVPSPPDGAPPSNSHLGCYPTPVGPDRGGPGPVAGPVHWQSPASLALIF